MTKSSWWAMPRTREELMALGARVERFLTDERDSHERDVERIARRFHEKYEALAPVYGWETQKRSAVPWEDLPFANKRLMIKVVSHLLHEGTIKP